MGQETEFLAFRAQEEYQRTILVEKYPESGVLGVRLLA